MAVSPKTIYLEIDEEVTSVIDKIRKTEFTDVVLVVPKDASISQSVVNLKLIKKKAEELNKNVSIVTQDKVARNLAEKLGIASGVSASEVARTAQPSKANIKHEESAGPLEDTNEVIFDKEPVLAEPDELTVMEGEDTRDVAEMHEDVAEKVAKYENNLMPKFPWKWVLLVAGVVVFGLITAGLVYLPRAKATIYVKAEKQPLSLDFTGTKDAKLDTEKVIIPTRTIEVTKESSKTFPATGQKDAGTKATGVVKVANLSDSPISIQTFAPTGRSDLIYTSTSPVTVNNDGNSVNINVVAQNPGEGYNGFKSTDFVPARGSISGVLIRSTADGMSGGTTKKVTIVSEGDINSAKDALTKEATDAAISEFNSKASELKIIEDTKKSEVVSSSASPKASAEATEFTMTVKVTTKALGFSLNDVSTIITSEVNRQLGIAKQIIDDGSSSAEVTVDSSDLATGKISGTIKTITYVSTKLDENSIKVGLSGLNDAKATNYLAGLGGVESSKLEYWPTFIKSFPRIKNHIYLSILVSDSSKE